MLLWYIVLVVSSYERRKIKLNIVEKLKVVLRYLVAIKVKISKHYTTFNRNKIM